MTPFRAVYGRDPPLLLKGCEIPSKVEAVNELQAARDRILEELRMNLLKAQDRMKVQADRHRREVTFEVGDWVYLKIQPYKLKSLANRPCEKLAARYYGPYQIIRKVGPVAYTLELPEYAKIHPTFHVSLLKKAVKPDHQPLPLPTMLNEEYELQVEPEEIIDWREEKDGNVEVLIKWKNLPDCDNNWEAAAMIQDNFPNFQLEDKLRLIGGSIDRLRRDQAQCKEFSQVYTRRNKARQDER